MMLEDAPGFTRNLPEFRRPGRHANTASMCGIAGIIDKTGRRSPEELAALAQTMADAMPYRGPDDSGVWADPQGGCALAHRRLSIIDTSSAGHQPLLSGDGRHVITFNGEFYGYRDLQAELTEAGVRFASRTDTEVLLEGLARRGTALLASLDAMYAFGLWDREARRLILARDPFGEKPLYYLDRPDLFAFASELQALATLPGFDATVTRDAVAAYLCWQYVPAPATIYRAARKLPPGSMLSLGPDLVPAVERYFRFQASGPDRSARPLDELAEELTAILTRTVERRLISDVPLGAFLSGGVDSTLVAALVTKQLGRPLDTFSIGFAGHEDSEHVQAREAAALLGTRHHEQVLAPDVLALGRRIGAMLDEPNGDTSCLPVWLLSGFTRERVTVALSGDGGDELFGGYNRYFDTLAEEEQRTGGWTPGRAYLSDRILVTPEAQLAELFGAVPDGLRQDLDAERRFLDQPDRPLIHRMRELDARHYLPGAVLAKVDRMSMQHSLEVRAPLLGLEVADFAARLAAEDCVQGNYRGKLVLKRVAERWVPREWLERKKRGFGLPMDGWGKAVLLPEAAALLTSAEARLPQWIARPALEAFLAAQERSFNPYRVWALFVLETWLRHHKAEPAEEPAKPIVFLDRARRFFGRLAG
jgi:asparagine synthase (glutamine-hydrolysing)